MLKSPIATHKTPSSPDGRGWKYVQPVSGNIFRAHGLDVLIGQIEKHRFAMAGRYLEMDLSFGWENRLKNDLCLQNPQAPCHDNPEAEGYVSPHIALGRALWAELHQKSENYTEPYALRDWFDGWINRAPDINGCRCRSNAIQLLNAFPPNFSREGFKSWTILFHNEINRRLGKRQWPYDS